jgi:hypothetical protein
VKHGRDPRRGSAPAFLLATLVLSCATGVGVYLYLKDHYAQPMVARAAAPKPVEAAPVEPAPAPAAVPTEPPAPVPIIPEPVQPAPDEPDDPDELSPAQVERTLAAARWRFADCAVTGDLALVMKIRPSGRVEHADVAGTDSDEMRTCVVTAAKRIRFPKSTKGLTTRYSLRGE